MRAKVSAPSRGQLYRVIPAFPKTLTMAGMTVPQVISISMKTLLCARWLKDQQFLSRPNARKLIGIWLSDSSAFYSTFNSHLHNPNSSDSNCPDCHSTSTESLKTGPAVLKYCPCDWTSNQEANSCRDANHSDPHSKYAHVWAKCGSNDT